MKDERLESGWEKMCGVSACRPDFSVGRMKKGVHLLFNDSICVFVSSKTNKALEVFL